MKVMIVDDEESNLDVLRIILEMAGHEVLPLMSAENLLSEILTYKPDLILLDILLRGFDGREICAQLKSMESTKTIPIIVMSAIGEQVLNTSFQYGANQVLSKPFDIGDVVKQIETIGIRD